MDRERLILETFELALDISLTRVNSQERLKFLRQWWNGTRDRVYKEYRKNVAALTFAELLGRRRDYVEMLMAVCGNEQ